MKMYGSGVQICIKQLRGSSMQQKLQEMQEETEMARRD
jgi:hypothetical protein